MAERAGKGLLSHVFGCRPVEASELKGAHEARIVHLVDLDEVARHLGMGVGTWVGVNADSLVHEAGLTAAPAGGKGRDQHRACSAALAGRR